MHFTTPLILLSSLALPYIALAEPTVPVLPPDQTIVPFATLPDCAASCGLLFDVQGACSPPQVQAASTKSCFCSDSRLTALKTSNTGVCDAAGCDATGLGQIQTWYKNLCGGTTSNTSPTTTGSTAAGTGVSAGTTNSSTAKKNGDGTWISTHVQWVVMAVIIIVAIIGGWVGAFLLRRRYLQRKERQYELRPPTTPWVAGSGANHSPYGDGIVDAAGRSKEARSSILSTPGAVRSKNRLSRPDSRVENFDGGSEKPKRKWHVTERT